MLLGNSRATAVLATPPCLFYNRREFAIDIFPLINTIPRYNKREEHPLSRSSDTVAFLLKEQ